MVCDGLSCYWTWGTRSRPAILYQDLIRRKWTSSYRSVRWTGTSSDTMKLNHGRSQLISGKASCQYAYIFSGQDEKKNVYRPVSAHVWDSFSRSKNSPIKKTNENTLSENNRAVHSLELLRRQTNQAAFPKDLKWRSANATSSGNPLVPFFKKNIPKNSLMN